MRACRLLLVLLLAAGAAGQANRSTPRDAARSLFHAISAGDRAAVRAALHADDDLQADYADAMADMIVSGKMLGDAARANFGKAGAGIGRGMLDPADLARLDQATVTEKDDVAIITVPGQPRPMSFRRDSDGRWGLVIYDLSTAPRVDITRQTKLVRLLAEAMQTSAAEISAGTYDNAEAATTAVQQRLHAVMLSFHRPATRPATATAPVEE